MTGDAMTRPEPAARPRPTVALLVLLVAVTVLVGALLVLLRPALEPAPVAPPPEAAVTVRPPPPPRAVQPPPPAPISPPEPAPEPPPPPPPRRALVEIDLEDLPAETRTALVRLERRVALDANLDCLEPWVHERDTRDDVSVVFETVLGPSGIEQVRWSSGDPVPAHVTSCVNDMIRAKAWPPVPDGRKLTSDHTFTYNLLEVDDGRGPMTEEQKESMRQSLLEVWRLSEEREDR